jgi:hypothetical protein
MALVFAVAPIHSLSLAAPAGAFSTAVIHAHDGGGEDHSHHSHDHHHDRDGAGTQDGLGPQGDGGPVHQGKGNLHVHHDACCPSVLVPGPAVDLPEQRLGNAFDRSLTQSLHGASPDSLLRPPISQLHI